MASAERLENYVFQNLERISEDKHYIDSLMFQHKDSRPPARAGLEPSQSCSEPTEISEKIFAQTLQHFVKILPEKKGIEKNLWAKQFIQKILYSREEIAINLFYFKDFEEAVPSSLASGCPHSAACHNKSNVFPEKNFKVVDNSLNFGEWLRAVPTNRTPIDFYLNLKFKPIIYNNRRLGKHIDLSKVIFSV